ncbi:MAG: hypothetical protein ACLQVJ_13545, partial [Syntrophobacteraceae bacterium]
HTKAFLPVNFERFTGGRLSYIPGNVKLWESAGRAGGLPCYLGIDVLFVYEPASNDPHMLVVVWLGPNELELTVDRVSHIYSQKTEASAVKIEYRIREVDDPYP